MTYSRRLFQRSWIEVTLVAILAFAPLFSTPARGQPALSGVSDFLSGFWKNDQEDTTRILLHNPSEIYRHAVLLFYNDNEEFLNCRVVSLSPHDFEIIGLIFPGAPPAYDQNARYSLGVGTGPVEIRSAPLREEDPNRPAGLTGYVQINDQVGERAHDAPQAGQTFALAPLFPIDKSLFNTLAENPRDMQTCACQKLKDIRSPVELVTRFCREFS